MDTLVQAVEQQGRATRNSRRGSPLASEEAPPKIAQNKPKDDPILDAASSDDEDDRSAASDYSSAVGWNLPKKVSLKGHVKAGANSVKELTKALSRANECIELNGD